MVPISAGSYHVGFYNETQAHAVATIPDCEAACLQDPACVQITWAPSHGDKCESAARTAPHPPHPPPVRLAL